MQHTHQHGIKSKCKVGADNNVHKTEPQYHLLAKFVNCIMKWKPWWRPTPWKSTLSYLMTFWGWFSPPPPPIPLVLLTAASANLECASIWQLKPTQEPSTPPKDLIATSHHLDDNSQPEVEAKSAAGRGKGGLQVLQFSNALIHVFLQFLVQETLLIQLVCNTKRPTPCSITSHIMQQDTPFSHGSPHTVQDGDWFQGKGRTYLPEMWGPMSVWDIEGVKLKQCGGIHSVGVVQED